MSGAVGADAPRGRIDETSSLHAALAEAVSAQGDVDGIACVDVPSGALIAAATRDRLARHALEFAAQVAGQLCSAPLLGSSVDGDDETRAREALVVSESAIHAFARSRLRPDRVVVGLARGNANVALLLAAVRAIADSLAGDVS